MRLEDSAGRWGTADVSQEIIRALSSLYESLSWGDILVAGILLLSAVVGFCSGFVWQLVRILGVLAAYWVAASYHEMAVHYFGGNMSEQTRMLLSYVAVFGGVLIGTYLLMFLFRRAITMNLETSDRLLGTALGLVKGFLICGIIVVGILRYDNQDGIMRQRIEESYLAKLSGSSVGAFWVGPSERGRMEEVEKAAGGP